MTFYWWSHWFWITLLCNLMFPLIVVVHTYPSQETTQVEYNQNENTGNNNKKLVTKLYQTSTTLTWTTEIPNLLKATTSGKLKPQNIINDDEENAAENPIKEDTLILNDKGDEAYYYDGDEDAEIDEKEDKTKKINLEQVEAELEKEDQEEFSKNQDNKFTDVKRSAEIFNKNATEQKSDLRMIDSTSATIRSAIEEEDNKNNYTNYTDTSTNSTITSLNSTTNATTNNKNNTNNSDSATATTLTTTTTTTATTSNATTTQLPQAPSTPKIVKAHPPGNLDWLNAVAAQLPPAHVTTDVTQDYPEDQHKIPFTLENVNKPEDLRREESEHRTRKSKGLSAEYKVNRYINYSSDSKNLLTRSAATTVNEYDSEESNISSEALSVQRAYFMDVGAISAICFTVFGIFCTVGTVGIVLYRRRFLNKPQALSEPDSSVYIDDSTMRVSDNSDEMYSLDNDSFLNSLEAMTIQNYWTDTVKHTKL